MIKTRITELFKIQHPIILAGMNWVTEPGLVSAVSNAGGLGILATAHLTPEETRRDIRRIKELTSKPFGINQMLIVPVAKGNIQVAIEEKVPIINYSLGRPWFIDKVHEYGGKVVGTIAIARHAVRAEELGVDAIIVTGHEAAARAHNATIMVLTPLVRDSVKVPIIAAGGFFDGRGLAAALLLGADAISMGTRFIVTKESIVHPRFKQLFIDATEQDTIYSDRFDGMYARVIKSKGAEAALKQKLPIMKSVREASAVRRLLKLSWWELTQARLKKGGLPVYGEYSRAVGAVRYQKAIFEGNVEEGLLPGGQAAGGIKDIPTCKELIDRIIVEAEQALEAACQKSTRFKVQG